MNEMSLDEVKTELLAMLVKFDSYCEKKGIRYYLCGGALIGAIRHKGFIPWDDDIDVIMPRDDYEKLFKAESEEKIDKNLELFSYKKGNSNIIFTKLGNTSTRVHNKYQKEKEVLSIDIFPVDGMSDVFSENRKNYAIMNIYKKIYALHLWRIGNGTSLNVKVLKMLSYPFAKIIPHKWICDKMDRLAKRYKFNESKYVGDIIWGYGSKEIVEREMFEPQIEVVFENVMLKTTAMYDEYLRQVYGDYMVLPPEEKRRNHELKVYRVR